MVTICGATLINIGTLSRRWIEAMTKAAQKAQELGKCWVLDPVGAGATPLRMQTCSELLKYHPTVIRGNASEIMALAGAISSGRGVDSTDSSAAALNAGKALAKEYKCVVGISGEVDYGEQMCTLITAAGCSLTSIICAFLAIGIAPMEATAFVRVRNTVDCRLLLVSELQVRWRERRQRDRVLFVYVNRIGLNDRWS